MVAFKENADSAHRAMPRGLGNGVSGCGMKAILKYLRVATGKELTPGIIAAIQSFGSRINLHPHLHFLVTEGGEDKEGKFHKISRFDEGLIAEFFSREVFSMLLRGRAYQPGACGENS